MLFYFSDFWNLRLSNFVGMEVEVKRANFRWWQKTAKQLQLIKSSTHNFSFDKPLAIRYFP